MEGVPTRFKRVAEAFRPRVSESSSGSEHLSEEESSSPDLYDLVNYFLEIEGGCKDHGLEQLIQDHEKEAAKSDSESNNASYDSETKDMLRSLLDYDDDDDVKLNIHHEAEKACRVLGNQASPDFKRQLMSRLRESGFDAGLCKSKWEKSGRILSGDYEYIDINANKTRYIVEVFLAGEFEIARPTNRYTSLLELLPSIFVGRVEELKQVVKLMCNGVKKSMKSAEMHMPPWRRHGYVQAKWFGSYKRTINDFSVRKTGLKKYCDDKYTVKRRSVGFPALNSSSTLNYCRQDFGSGGGVVGFGSKVGNLAAVMNGTTMLL